MRSLGLSLVEHDWGLYKEKFGHRHRVSGEDRHTGLVLPEDGGRAWDDESTSPGLSATPRARERQAGVLRLGVSEEALLTLDFSL